MEFTDTLEVIINRAAKSIPAEPEDYEKDGRLYCGKCHTPKQSVITFMGQIRKPMCLCKCAAEQREREEEERQHAERMLKVEQYRRMGFAESDMAHWNFENDDGQNQKLTNVMKNYVKNFKQLRQEGKGLLLYGGVGTGKTYYACCIANAIIDNGYPCLVTNFARLANTIQGKFKDKQEYIDSLNKFYLLVIDDLGAERQSEFMQEIVYNIIDARYRAGLPFIVTTNLQLAEIKNPDNVGNARIYDRILERCFPVEVSGGSRRRQAIREGYDEYKEMLGL